MNPILIEPTDVLFFRDAHPMSAGQGKGEGCRLPFPSSFHEALRSNLLAARGETPQGKTIPGRPRHASRKGNWHADSYETDRRIASKAFRSLRTVGPLPVKEDEVLFPVPSDAVLTGAEDKKQLSVFDLLATGGDGPSFAPVSTVPPDKNGALAGWWSAGQYARYANGNFVGDFTPIPTSALWEPEHRMGVQIDPGSHVSSEGQLYASRVLRPAASTRFFAGWEVTDSRTQGQERTEIKALDRLLLGGEHRMARLLHTSSPLPAGFHSPPKIPVSDSPCILKWVLLTPAIFASGHLPGWCKDTSQNRAGGPFSEGRVCFDLPGKARLVSWCIGRPRAISGWDVAEGKPKPTRLAVPEGSVYYFLCENSDTARSLAAKLHWQPRSDFYGEKGCGYGLVATGAKLHPSSPIESLKNLL